ncbi:MAG: pentapeptide repeat-containing protein [Oscillospiraceae bacterium]|nr:pentapeptide repeat-containing protein [Oscillospiraceae bacterium]
MKRLVEYLKATEVDKIHQTIIAFLCIAVIVFGGIFCFLYFGAKPEQSGGVKFTTKDYLNIAQTISLSFIVFTGAAASAVGYRLQSIKETDATNKRFNEAVRSLCSGEDVFVRIEGIYALERLAFNAPNSKERQRVMDILCTYLRKKRSVDKFKENKSCDLKEDHKAIIEVIKRINQRYKGLDVNLSETNLYKANFGGAYLEETEFRFAHLESVNFNHAHLKKVNFMDAHLEKATFLYAHFEIKKTRSLWIRSYVIMPSDAHLEGADFDYAYIRGKVYNDGVCSFGGYIDRIEKYYDIYKINSKKRQLQTKENYKSYNVPRDS